MIRENPNVAGELIMLGDHNRSVILGAWTGVEVSDGAVVAADYRWASPEVEPQVARYRGLVDERLLWGTSIGFTGRWFFAPELPDSDPDKDSGASWIIEGTEENPIEVYEASLVTIGADADSMITYEFAADEGGTRGAALELEPEDERVVEGIAGSLMLQHLVNEHGMDAEAAEDAVRRMLAGEDPDVIEDEDGEDDAGEMADDDEGEDADGVFFDVPQDVQDAAERGLADAEEYGRAEGGPGAATARALVSGRVDAAKIVEMVVWWARWEDAEPPEEAESDGGPSATEIRWAQWGGNPRGAEWARSHEDAAREEEGSTDAEASLSHTEAPEPEAPVQSFAEFLTTTPQAPDGATFADFLRAVPS